MKPRPTSRVYRCAHTTSRHCIELVDAAKGGRAVRDVTRAQAARSQCRLHSWYLLLSSFRCPVSSTYEKMVFAEDDYCRLMGISVSQSSGESGED